MNYEKIQDLAELISLGLTWPTLAASMCVVIYWLRPTYKSLTVNHLDAHNWFIIGVTISFIGAFVDNLYWSIPWTASYLELDITPTLVNFGVFVNIPFRQACGVIAALCHVHAAILTAKSSPRARCIIAVLTLSIFAGIAYCVVLTLLK